MESNNFNIIINTLDDLINKCEQTIGDIKSKADIDNMTLNQVRTMVTECRQLYSQMDKINQTDLYHIIGMGKLTVTQRNIFWAKLEKFLTYRPDLHNLSTLNIPDTPNIPAQTSYTLKALGNVKVTNKK